MAGTGARYFFLFAIGLVVGVIATVMAMRALEARARPNGWCSIVSDTTDNLLSANNFIRAGYRLFEPKHPWAWPHTLYWRKVIK